MIAPEPFPEEQSWKDWIDQFQSTAVINGWKDKQKLIRLKVCLTRRALLTYNKFSATAWVSFKNVVIVLAKYFEPESKKVLYLVEFQSHWKKRTELWEDFGKGLRVIVDKAYPMLKDDPRQQLALQYNLSQLHKAQVALANSHIRKPVSLGEGALPLRNHQGKILVLYLILWY